MKEGREAKGIRGTDVGFEHSAVKVGREATGTGALTLVLNTPL